MIWPITGVVRFSLADQTFDRSDICQDPPMSRSGIVTLSALISIR